MTLRAPHTVPEESPPELWTGRFFEDFEVGNVYQHPMGRTITATDNSWFTLLTMNTNPLHFNDHYAEQGEFRRQLVNSGLTVAIVLGQSVSDVSQNAVANLGWTDIKLVHPVFLGDTLYADSLITDLRPSRSRPNAGIVSTFTRGLNQDGVTVLTFRRSVMVLRREAGLALERFPGAARSIRSEYMESIGSLSTGSEGK